MLISAFASWKRQLRTRIQNANHRPGRATRRRTAGPFASLVETLEPRQLLSATVSETFLAAAGTGEIRGTAFEDIDGDGVRDFGEGPLAGVTVYLDSNANGAFDVAGTAEPDNFANGTDLTNAVPGVTLTVAGSNNIPNTFFKVRAGTNPFSSTGEKVFFEEGIPFWTSGFRFRADFDEPVSTVSLDFISSGGSQSGRMLVFDGSGNLLDTVTTSSLSTGRTETMRASRATADIAFVVAYTFTGSFGRLDNLQFGTPEASTQTDADGKYAFTELAAGEYIVRQVVPEDFRQTSPSDGHRGCSQRLSSAHIASRNSIPPPAPF